MGWLSDYLQERKRNDDEWRAWVHVASMQQLLRPCSSLPATFVEAGHDNTGGTGTSPPPAASGCPTTGELRQQVQAKLELERDGANVQ